MVDDAYSFFELLGALFVAYGTDALPFAILHGIVLVFVGREIYHLAVERRALQRYASSEKEEPGDEEYSLRSVLVQFEKEAHQLGKQGLVVPMTDFSDRLDAATEQIAGRLQDYATLLLTIGIAGTMFGVFEFAIGAQEAVTVDPVTGDVFLDTTEVSRRLADSMAKAFPVGFIGLILMFIVQAISSFSENRLQRTISLATQKALSTRSGVVISQGEQVLEAAKAIQEGLEPLRDLRQTLTESVQPVVEALASRLDEAFGILRSQFDELRTTTDHMHEATQDARTLIAALKEEATSLRDVVQRTPAVLDNLLSLQERQKENLEQLSASVEQLTGKVHGAAQKVEGAAERLTQLPDEVLSLSQRSATRTREEVLKLWQERAEEMALPLKELSETVLQTAHQLDTTSAKLQELPRSIFEANKGVLEEVEQEVVALWRDMAGELSRELHGQYAGFLNSIEQQLADLPKQLGEAASELSALAANYRLLLVDQFQEAVREALGLAEERIDQVLLSRYPEAVHKVDTVTEAFDGLTHKLLEVKASFELALERAKQAEREIYEVGTALRATLERDQMPGPNGNADEVPALLTEVKDVLYDIRDNTPIISIGPFRRKKRG